MPQCVAFILQAPLVHSRDPKSMILLNASIWTRRKIRTSIFCYVPLHPLPVPNWAMHLNSIFKEAFCSQVLQVLFHNAERGLNMKASWQLPHVVCFHKQNKWLRLNNSFQVSIMQFAKDHISVKQGSYHLLLALLIRAQTNKQETKWKRREGYLLISFFFLSGNQLFV